MNWQWDQTFSWRWNKRIGLISIRIVFKTPLHDVCLIWKLTWFIGYLYYWNFQFLRDEIIIKTNVLLPREFTSSLTSKHICYEGVAFISNLVHTTHFMNDLHQGRAKWKHWKANYLIKIQPKRWIESRWHVRPQYTLINNKFNGSRSILKPLCQHPFSKNRNMYCILLIHSS
jgi:hypothetical protein